MKGESLWEERERVPFNAMFWSTIKPNSVKVAKLRKKGKVGKNVKIGTGSVIIAENAEIGDNVSIAPGVVIRCKTLKVGAGSSIGMMCFFDAPYISIGKNTKIREQVMIGGMTFPDSKITIGDNVTIFQSTVLNPTKPITIGNGVGIGGDCHIFTHSSWQSIFKGYPTKFGPVTIEDGAWLPWCVFVMPNVTIGTCATIGACSVVTKNIPPYTLAVGSPARVIRERQDYLFTVTPDMRVTLLRDMLLEFLKYCDFMGVKTAMTELGDGWNKVKTVGDKSKQGRGCLYVLLSRSHKKPGIPDNVGEDDVVVFISEMYELLKPVLGEKSMICPDTEKKSGKMNPLANEFMRYMERYGVRFVD
jgi:acetyltransferase-like isoleucine patch superfamily enzyme